jgi:steroid 5-alpha reductase family enzyme
MISLIYALIFAVVLNILIFLIAFALKSDKLTDITYSLTFASLAAIFFIYNQANTAKTILLVMILLWAARLGGYLLYRVIKFKKDSRFDEMRNNFLKFFFFWLFQGITVWIILVPSMLYFNTQTTLNNISYLGIAIFIIGLVIETVADIQKFKFVNNPKNKDKWIEQGLWRYSRHPNYFGEILIWIGIYVYAINSINWLYGLISPLFISFILLYVSGVPMLEKKNDEKFKDNEEYWEYKKKTSLLIPWPK